MFKTRPEVRLFVNPFADNDGQSTSTNGTFGFPRIVGSQAGLSLFVFYKITEGIQQDIPTVYFIIFSIMAKIDPKKEYSIQEVLDEKLIPGVTGHTAMYNLLTVKVPSDKGKLKRKRLPATETTKTTIKADESHKPWNKISNKIMVKGSEIIKFLKIHNLI